MAAKKGTKKPKKQKRRDTTLEARGAEFLVLGQLLIESIQSFKAYKNYPGYDVIATNPKKNKSCRVQVKSRWATDYGGAFLIDNFDCDFVAFVALNRGYRRRKKTPEDDGHRTPQFFIFPAGIVKKAQYAKSTWGKVFLKHINAVEQYKNNWSSIADFLA